MSHKSVTTTYPIGWAPLMGTKLQRDRRFNNWMKYINRVTGSDLRGLI